MIIVSLDILLTTINYTTGMAAISIYDRELHHLTFLPVLWIKTTCTKEDTHHIETTIIVGILHPLMFSLVIDSVLA